MCFSLSDLCSAKSVLYGLAMAELSQATAGGTGTAGSAAGRPGRPGRRGRAHRGPSRGPDHRVRRGRAGQPGPVHRERGPAGDRPRSGYPQSGRPVLGAERLRDRVRLAARAGGQARRPAPAQVRLPAGGGHLHGGLGRLRGRQQRGHADRLPAGAGGRGGAAHPHLAQPGARLVPAAAAQRGGPGLDRDRRCGGRLRAGDRRPAGRGQLALGVPGQRPDRDRGPRGRLAPAARRARPSRSAPGRAGGRPGHAGAWPRSPSAWFRAVPGAGLRA